MLLHRCQINCLINNDLRHWIDGSVISLANIIMIDDFFTLPPQPMTHKISKMFTARLHNFLVVPKIFAIFMSFFGFHRKCELNNLAFPQASSKAVLRFPRRASYFLRQFQTELQTTLDDTSTIQIRLHENANKFKTNCAPDAISKIGWLHQRHHKSHD